MAGSSRPDDLSRREMLEEFDRWHEKIEAALWDEERSGSLEAACLIYQDAITSVSNRSPDADIERRRQQVLSYAWLRSANVLRQMGRVDDARQADEEGLEAARLTGEAVSLGRALLSAAGTSYAEGRVDKANLYLDESRAVFESGSSSDHCQGLGWTYVLTADVGNAGLVEITPEQVLDATANALELLNPISNWPGIARAHSAASVALVKLGRDADAVRSMEQARRAETRSSDS